MAQRCLVFCIVMVTGCIAAPMEDQIVPEGTLLVDPESKASETLTKLGDAESKLAEAESKNKNLENRIRELQDELKEAEAEDVTERGTCLSSYNNRYGACSNAYCDGKAGQYGCTCKASTAASTDCYDDGSVSVTCNDGGFCVKCYPNMNGVVGCPCSNGQYERGTCAHPQAGQGNDSRCLQFTDGWYCYDMTPVQQ